MTSKCFQHGPENIGLQIVFCTPNSSALNKASKLRGLSSSRLHCCLETRTDFSGINYKL